MVIQETRSILYTIKVHPTVIEEIRVVQSTDPQLDKIKMEVPVGKAPGLMIHEDGTLRFQS